LNSGFQPLPVYLRYKKDQKVTKEGAIPWPELKWFIFLSHRHIIKQEIKEEDQ
jgi:hypothetical protein